MIELARHCALGIDIGGTKLRLGLVTENLEILKCSISEEHRNFTPEQLVDFIALNVSKLLENCGNIFIVGAGVGYPGPVDFKKGSTFSYTNLRNSAWEKTPLKEFLEKKLKMPVLLDNDANLVGLAEMRIGAGKNFTNAVYLTISTGTGGAIFIDRKLYRGSLGSAGEFGHMVVDINGFSCKCGNTGCLMSLLSGLGLEEFINREPLCKNLFLSDRTHEDCVRKLFDLLSDQHPKLLKAIEPLIQYLSVAFLNIIQILNPEVIIVGGSLGKRLVNLFSHEIRTYLSEHLPKEVIENTYIKEAELGEYGGVIGGAIMVFES
ncbi:MAG: glucokinase [Candidatus Atribacteria bacterium]|uniref:ROK family protein n=1 Tax=Atrimonas thermophila TaxID=3064161 RepID=UPI0024AA5EFB|nr:glucokinase [Candidatus Atribacteria bacterium]